MCPSHELQMLMGDIHQPQWHNAMLAAGFYSVDRLFVILPIRVLNKQSHLSE
jgi:hypothetical protein